MFCAALLRHLLLIWTIDWRCILFCRYSDS